jgi:hypothetical protein
MDIKETDAEFRIDTVNLSGTPTFNIPAESEYQIAYGKLNTSLSVTGGVISGALGQNSIYTTTSTGAGGYNWNIAPDYNAMSQISQASLELRGENADIKINGRSMCDWMVKVEERLNILTPNPELEKDWDELRRLGERYKKLEKKCKQKAEMWKQLKKMPAPRPDQF